MNRSLFPVTWKLTLTCLTSLAVSFPLFLGAAPGDEHWDPQFGWAGPGGNTYAIAMHEGRMYAGVVAASTNVALQVWDGAQWSAASQFYGTIAAGAYDLAFVGDTLYAAGVFTNIDGVAVTNLAKWDGTSWSSLGFSRGTAYTLAVEGNRLYVGGTFTNIGGVAITNVGCWDGSAWHALGAGLGSSSGGAVNALVVTNGTLYVGGSFTNSGSMLLSSNVARWDGASWSALGSGLGSPVYSLALKGTELYAGGLFGSSPYSGVAKWDGAAWSLCGSGFNNGVQSVAVWGDLVCATGNFTTAGTGAATRFAVWDGASWTGAGSGLSASGLRVYPAGARVYVGGTFGQAGGLMVNGLAAWDGANWSRVGPPARINGLSYTVNALAGDAANVYAGGGFTSAGRTTANYVARFDGTNWSALGSGLSGSTTPSVKTITVSGTNVYVGGSFSSAGGVSAPNIAQWNGSTWQGLGGSPGGVVSAILVRPEGVYAVGAPLSGSTYGGPFFKRWDGTSWQSLLLYNDQDTLWSLYFNDSSIGLAAMAELGSDIYIGGHLSITQYDPTFTYFTNCPNIMRFNGTWMRTVGTGLNSNVAAMVTLNGNLYVAGLFTTAGGLPANHIAKWDGAAWSSVGGGQVGNGYVYALAARGNDLYASGTFTNLGGVPVNRIAKWNGTTWSALGSGFVNPAGAAGSGFALAFSGNDLYAGGSFKVAGGKPSGFIGRWNDQVNFHTPQLLDPCWLPNRQFRVRLQGVAGVTNLIQASTNLKAWTPVLTNSAGIYDFTDTDAGNYARRFYRALLGP